MFFSLKKKYIFRGFLIIFIFSFFLTIYTLFISIQCDSNIFAVAFFRFLHFYLFIYNSFFIFLFQINSIDSLFYLFEILLMLFTWYILKLCPMTYYELKICNSNEEIKSVKTTFHPIIKILFNEWDETVMKIVGVLVFLNIIYILYNEKTNIIYKIIYFFIFCYFFVDSIIKSRYNEQIYGENINEKIIFYVFSFSLLCVFIYLFLRIRI